MPWEAHQLLGDAWPRALPTGGLPGLSREVGSKTPVSTGSCIAVPVISLANPSSGKSHSLGSGVVREIKEGPTPFGGLRGKSDSCSLTSVDPRGGQGRQREGKN